MGKHEKLCRETSQIKKPSTFYGELLKFSFKKLLIKIESKIYAQMTGHDF